MQSFRNILFIDYVGTLDEYIDTSQIATIRFI